ncbi:MAG: TIGR00266 family protein [Chloroflexi bacterium HGW-Chloroflexi-10]|nr:MAG: TIGR00266 family protein [Chloroflexi bacterium HGW-Chloroflexi-10]
MEIDIQFRPSYSLAIVKLVPNERIRTDSGSMVSHSADVEIETKAEGGFLKSLGRAVLGGESFFQNFWKAGAQGGEVTLAPDLPGDMAMIQMTGQTLMIQSGSYLASEAGIELSTKLSGKAFKAGEGVSMLEASGSGKLLVSSYGAIFEKDLASGEKYIVDSSHLVAFDGSMNVEALSVGGLKSTLLSGEGLVVQLTGPGHIYIQTRSPQALISWIIPQVPTKSS